jgi:cytochrome P450
LELRSHSFRLVRRRAEFDGNGGRSGVKTLAFFVAKFRPALGCDKRCIGRDNLGGASQNVYVLPMEQSSASQLIREVLRLYPPAWIIGRETLRDVTLSDGSHIPAKMTVFMVPLLLHRKPQYFTNPDAFEPDRWLEDEPPPFAYIPFGGGARRCIGDEFALRETTIVLETLLRQYRFALEPGARVETAPLVTLRPAGPFLCEQAPAQA